MSASTAEKRGALSRVRAMSWFVRCWYLPVWILLGLSRLAIITLRFRVLVRILGEPAVLPFRRPSLSSAERQRANEIGLVIRSASCRTPWKSNCFTQAVAARVMLGLFGLPWVVIFGVQRSRTNGARLAHAWVSSGAVRVTGGHGQQRYAFSGAFASPPCASPDQQNTVQQDQH